MDRDFWHGRWRDGAIGFHQPVPNGRLTDHYAAVTGQGPRRVFTPLCGKTHDIGWLRTQGAEIVGVELSAVAVDALFETLGLTPQIDAVGPLSRRKSDGVEIWVGDVFDLTRSHLGPVDLVYDRAALIALPTAMRRAYARHIRALTDAAAQLVVTLEYDQQALEGPPFSVDEAALRACYGAGYSLESLSAVDVPGGLKGRAPAVERAWRLTPRHAARAV